jgi:hypothetical protein
MVHASPLWAITVGQNSSFANTKQQQQQQQKFAR